MMRHQIFKVPESLPEGKRRGAVDLQVRKNFPFREPEFDVLWNGNEASVYAWEIAPVRAAQQEAGVPRNCQVVPETMMKERGQDGIRLLATMEGFEGQLWNNGFLRASRWWPNRPSGDEWGRFQRSVGLQASQTESTPEAIQLPMLERPWTEGAFSLSDWSSLLRSRNAVTGLVVAAACPFVFLGTEIAVLSMAESSVRAELSELDSKNKAIRSDRNAALANLDGIEDLLRLDEYPPQADILTKAMALLAQTGAPRIISWSFDRGTLEIILRGGQPLDPTAYITLFERDEIFENASGTLIGQERDLQLRMTVAKRVKV